MIFLQIILPDNFLANCFFFSRQLFEKKLEIHVPGNFEGSVYQFCLHQLYFLAFFVKFANHFPNTFFANFAKKGRGKVSNLLKTSARLSALHTQVQSTSLVNDGRRLVSEVLARFYSCPWWACPTAGKGRS